MKRIIPILLFTVATNLGCHWFDSVDDLHDCPLNSQFPCPCSTSCENGQICLQKQGTSGTYGQCTLPCNGINQVCRLASNGYGVGGAGGQCLENGYCGIGCIFEDDCPAGMLCAADAFSASSVCVPGGGIDSGVFQTNSDTDTQPTDTGTSSNGATDSDSGSALTQQEIDCQAYIDAAFFCNSNQEQTKSEVQESCVNDNWYGIDDCFYCVINNQCPALAPGGENCDSAAATEACCQAWVDCYLECEACKSE